MSTRGLGSSSGHSEHVTAAGPRPRWLTQALQKRQKQPRPTITAEQASAPLTEMDKDRLWCYWLLAFALGFRRGEGLGMRWADLDLRERTWTPLMTVQRLRGELDPDTGKRGKGRLVAKELKTAASAEKVAIGATAASDLARWRREQMEMRLAAPRWADHDLVFTTGVGTALEPRNVNRAWVAICKRAGAVKQLRSALRSDP